LVFENQLSSPLVVVALSDAPSARVSRRDERRDVSAMRRASCDALARFLARAVSAADRSRLTTKTTTTTTTKSLRNGVHHGNAVVWGPVTTTTTTTTTAAAPSMMMLSRHRHEMTTSTTTTTTTPARPDFGRLAWLSRRRRRRPFSSSASRPMGRALETFKAMWRGEKLRYDMDPNAFDLDAYVALVKQSASESQGAGVGVGPLEGLRVNLDQIVAIASAMTADEKADPGRLKPPALRKIASRVRCVHTLVPIRPRRRGERRSLRTFAGASLRPGSLAFNPRPRRLSTPLLTPLKSTPTSHCMERP